MHLAARLPDNSPSAHHCRSPARAAPPARGRARSRRRAHRGGNASSLAAPGRRRSNRCPQHVQSPWRMAQI
eukprot:scaffold30495_cov71-Phaeocystis_antarctica.AAC.9